MIFGESYKQKQDEKAKKTGIWFAWRPIRLANGRWVWWQQVNRVQRWIKDCFWYDYFEI